MLQICGVFATRYELILWYLSPSPIDGSDDLFSQSPKRARKPSTKKDAIEDLFDNDTDDFLDQVDKEKNGPADDAPVDMVSVCL